MIMMQGGAVQATTVVPKLNANSVGEAEYCTAALCIMAGCFIRKLYNEFRGEHADQPLTIPLGLDSKAAQDIAASARETNRTRHIERRYHYYRESEQQGHTRTFYIPGEENWSNNLTKPERADQIKKEAEIFHVDVPE